MPHTPHRAPHHTHVGAPGAGVPTVWLALLSHLDAHKLKFTTFKMAAIGGAAPPRSMIEALEKRYGVEVRHLWGMTELCPLGTLGGLKGALQGASPEERLNAKVKQGRPHVLCDMRIVDDEGKVRVGGWGWGALPAQEAARPGARAASVRVPATWRQRAWCAACAGAAARRAHHWAPAGPGAPRGGALPQPAPGGACAHGCGVGCAFGTASCCAPGGNKLWAYRAGMGAGACSCVRACVLRRWTLRAGSPRATWRRLTSTGT